MAPHLYNIYLSPRLYRALRLAAAHAEMPMAEIVREAVESDARVQAAMDHGTPTAPPETAPMPPAGGIQIVED